MQENQLIRTGALRAALAWDRVPRRLPPGEPPGTRSQVIKYFDQNHTLLVVVHCYLRPDGALGQSGKLDPKIMLVGQEYWEVEQ